MSQVWAINFAAVAGLVLFIIVKSVTSLPRGAVVPLAVGAAVVAGSLWFMSPLPNGNSHPIQVDDE